MRILFLTLLFTFSFKTFGQDGQIDFSELSQSSNSLEHLLPLFTIHGIPQNQNQSDTLIVLINHGYVVGFSKKHNQPAWVAYQVSKAKKDLDYERFPFFKDDFRLNPKNRIGTETFGNGYDLGHLAPNAAINKQYGKLSQMETFLMSNISPQSANLNRGVWQKLENEILNKYPYATDKKIKKEHVWIIVGPVFSDSPQQIQRPNGTTISIPDAFYCILIRPRNYPFDSPGNSEYLTFIFPQNIERNQKIDSKYMTSINHLEQLTKLNFFPELSKLMEERIENQIAAEIW
jgi:endonuclease G, mitochondrial